jgi:TPR repeat protein
MKLPNRSRRDTDYMSADQNLPRARFNYGFCLEVGIGVAIDLIGTAKYYKLAADQNHATAQFKYGLCLEFGPRLSVDFISAAKYYNLAADQNLANAQYNYGLCLELGNGVSVDVIGSPPTATWGDSQPFQATVLPEHCMSFHPVSSMFQTRAAPKRKVAEAMAALNTWITSGPSV